LFAAFFGLYARPAHPQAGVPPTSSSAGDMLNEGSVLRHPPLRSDEGIALIQNALRALGDPQGFAANESCTVKGTTIYSDQSTAQHTWVVEPHNYLRVSQFGNQESVFGSQTPFQMHGKTYRPSEYVNRSTFYPAASPVWLARALTNPGISVSDVTSETLLDKTVEIVRIADEKSLAIAAESTQKWYIDPASHLPIRVDYKIPSKQMSGVASRVHADITKYESFRGLMFPSSVSLFLGNTPLETQSIVSAQCSRQIHENSYFDARTRSYK